MSGRLSVERLVAIAAVNAMIAVVAGAFGAHGLRGRLTPTLLGAFETGAQYHFYHALGLVAVAFALARVVASTWINLSAWLMLSGIVLFSGSLYGLALTGATWLGMITPLGGLAFIAAWLCLAIGLLRA